MTDYTILGGKIHWVETELGAIAQHDFTVPQGKHWRFIGGFAERDVNATFQIDFMAIGGVSLYLTEAEPAGVTNLYIPGNLTFGPDRVFITSGGLIIPPGGAIRFIWGAAQTSPVVRLWVHEY